MKDANRTFLKVIGIFGLFFSSIMLMTGYWADLQGFGVSQNLFSLVKWLGFGMSTVALLVGIFAPRANT